MENKKTNSKKSCEKGKNSMLKKVALGFGALAAAIATVPMFAAFEAHVINVTAQIENALSVSTFPINFGTVFPEETFQNRPITIGMSGSFLSEVRVDDIDYIIKQKPKCQADDPENPDQHVPVNTVNGDHVCPERYHIMPLLCPYLSKTDLDPEDRNDGPNIAPFHSATASTFGHLTKIGDDSVDVWDIDLHVPCFKGHCAQDNVVPEEWQLDPGDEGGTFGCDIWIEVTGISQTSESGLVRLSTSDDFTLGGGEFEEEETFSPPIGSTMSASSTAYYSVRTISSSLSSIPTVQWKVTVEGPASLSVGDVHIDEVGWQDPDEVNIETFHYPMSVVSGDLMAKGSCEDPDPEHSDGCAVDDFDVDPVDDFTNIDIVHFSGSAPLGTYFIRRQLVDTETGAAISNEIIVAIVELVP